MKKYELVTGDTIIVGGATLTRIRALKDIQHDGTAHASIACGELGGYVQSESNLSQEGLCWIAPHAKAYGKSRVIDNALLWNEAEVCQRAVVYGDAVIGGKINANAKVGGTIKVAPDEVISGNSHLK